MADIIAYNETHIVDGELGNKRDPSCAGVPAYDPAGTLANNAYIYVNLWLALAADSANHLWARPVNGKVEQTGMTDMYGNDWDAFFCAKKDDFTMTFNKGGGNLWDQVAGEYFYRSDWMDGYVGENGHGISSFGKVAQPTTDADAKSKGFARLPFDLDDLETTVKIIDGVQRTTSYVYLAIPVLYDSTPTDSVRLQAVSFEIMVDELMRYHPFAVRKGGSWASCNRAAGTCQIRKGGSWRDVYNVPGGSNDQDAFIRDGSSWARAPKIGAE